MCPLRIVQPRTDKGKSPSFTIRGTYLGISVNRTARTRKRAVAVKVLKQIEHQIERGEFSKPGEPTFTEAALAYVKATDKRRFVMKLAEHFGETPISKIDQSVIEAAALKIYPTASPATRNRQIFTPASAVLRHAGVQFALRRPHGAAGRAATAWLWPAQAFRLFAEAEKIDQEFAALLIVLCYTGLRLSEALRLTWNEIRLEEGFAYVGQTKNDQPRPVFLPPVAVAALANIDKRERVFRFAKSGHLYSLLRVVAIRSGVELPERSAFHIFRHTYATWMRRELGLDLKALAAAGGWRDLKSVARYAHVVVTEEAKKAALLPTPTRKI